MTQRKYLPRQEASEYIHNRWGLKYSPKTLAKLACTGGGPEYQVFGRTPVYLPANIDKWVLSKLSEPVRSTSEYMGPSDAH